MLIVYIGNRSITQHIKATQAGRDSTLRREEGRTLPFTVQLQRYKKTTVCSASQSATLAADKEKQITRERAT